MDTDVPKQPDPEAAAAAYEKLKAECEVEYQEWDKMADAGQAPIEPGELSWESYKKKSLDAAEVDRIAQAICDPEYAVEHLDLSECNLEADSAVKLAQALAGNTKIKSIDMSSNPISDEGAKAFATALTSNSVLTYLNVDNCKLTDEGIVAIAEMVGVNTSLMRLNIQANEMKNAGASALASALKRNPSHKINTLYAMSLCQWSSDVDKALLSSVMIYPPRKRLPPQPDWKALLSNPPAA